MKKYKLRPAFVEVHRISPMTFRSIDVGVTLDMMIHDIDIVNDLVRAPVEDVRAVGVAVIGEHEDIANAAADVCQRMRGEFDGVAVGVANGTEDAALFTDGVCFRGLPEERGIGDHQDGEREAIGACCGGSEGGEHHGSGAVRIMRNW